MSTIKTQSSVFKKINTNAALSNKRNRNGFFKFIPILKEKIYKIRHSAGSGDAKYLTPNQLNLIDDKAFFSEFRDYDEDNDPNLLQKRPIGGKRGYFSVSANFLSLSLLSKEDLNRKSSSLFPYFFSLKKKERRVIEKN